MRLLVASFALWLLPLSAGAVTMTFSGLTGTPSSYAENGITARSGLPGSFYWIAGFRNPGAVHLDAGGTSYARIIDFTMGLNFNALSFDLLPVGMHYVTCNAQRKCVRDIYKNVSVEGFRDGSSVASLRFYMGTQNSTVSLGSVFNNLSKLRISVLFGGPIGPRPTPGGYCTNLPCSHFDIDNVRLAPVPLPSGFPLMATALAGIALIGRRRRAYRA